MTSKSGRGNKVEAEIEKCREESNWRRVIELADQLKSSKNFPEALSNFLLGEGKLESYLEEHPPSEANISKAKNGLLDAKKYLEMCSGDATKKVEVSLDALLLLSKLEYACGNYQTALKRLEEAGLHQLTEKTLPTRSLRVVAESYAIEGLCLEKTNTPYSTKGQPADKNDKLIRCFELAGDLTLLYLQEQDKLVSTPSTQSLPSIAASVTTTGSASPLPPNGEENKKMGIILETALQRAPILYMKAGKIEQAINRYRSMLMAVESTATQHLRLTLARQLAEVLLRGCSDNSYFLPSKSSTGERNKSLSNLKAVESPWKPRKYTGSNLFVPTNVNEEIILLLLISEAMAIREAVLSQYPEFTTARTHAYNNATAVYDLLCIALARRKQFQILLEVFERAMKFSFEANHVWQQFGLALACSKQLVRALYVLKEVHKLLPTQPHNCLLAARICFQHLGKVEDGLEWVRKALNCLDEGNVGNTTTGPGYSNSILTSRCYLYLGLGYTMQAMHSHRNCEIQSLKSKAFEALTRAQQIDSADHLVEYYLAFNYAQNRQLVEATQHVKMALYLRAEHPPSLLLLILLLSAQRENEEALQLCEAAVSEYPEHLQLLYLKASLEEELLGCDAALLTARHMLSLWNALYKDEMVSDLLDSPSQMHGNHDNYSLFNMSEKDTVSVHAESVAASRVEAALSEVASSLSSYQQKKGPQQAWLLQIQIWLLTAQLYLKL
ncbi:Tetratricopeptide repeat protein 7B [Armadillidium vulgare]|nr:Tetratricopeptide repeat protein 7B [Armadillidium vulgare]